MKDLNKLRIQITYVDIDTLYPNPKNPRSWDERSTDNLTTSIKTHGLTEALIVNSNKKYYGRIISGHFRWHVAKTLGIKKVPVIWLDIADEKEETDLLLRMNANVGDWDHNLLKSFELDQLIEAGLSDFDLSHVWDLDLETEEDDWNTERELKKITKPKTKPGEIYQLGGSRLGCLDSTDPNSLKRLFGKDKASMIFSDPIYNVSLSYDRGVGGRGHYGGVVKDKKSDKEYKIFLKKSLEAALAVSKTDLHVFYFCDQNYVGTVQDVFKEAKLKNKRTCLWVKNGFSPTSNTAFNRCYEPCPYSTRGKPYLAPIKNLNEILNKEIGTGNHTVSDILDLIDIWIQKRLPGQQYLHPTQKPVGLYERAIRRCSKVGDIICDSFLGSGTSLIAAEQLKRRVYGCEIDPRFCDLIIKRYEQYSGKKAEKISG